MIYYNIMNLKLNFILVYNKFANFKDFVHTLCFMKEEPGRIWVVACSGRFERMSLKILAFVTLKNY